jgi:hypothetical protein
MRITCIKLFEYLKRILDGLRKTTKNPLRVTGAPAKIGRESPKQESRFIFTGIFFY